MQVFKSQYLDQPGAWRNRKIAAIANVTLLPGSRSTLKTSPVSFNQAAVLPKPGNPYARPGVRFPRLKSAADG
jgi:hypothetical protein